MKLRFQVQPCDGPRELFKFEMSLVVLRGHGQVTSEGKKAVSIFAFVVSDDRASKCHPFLID